MGQRRIVFPVVSDDRGTCGCKSLDLLSSPKYRRELFSGNFLLLSEAWSLDAEETSLDMLVFWMFMDILWEDGMDSCPAISAAAEQIQDAETCVNIIPSAHCLRKFFDSCDDE